MKAKLYDISGNPVADIDLPKIFAQTIRADLAQKYFEVEKFMLRQVYASYDEAGKRHSASGTISKLRHTWKGSYGKGISRVPRKAMWRRGTQFFWVGAEVSGTRGGRISHPPKGVFHARKINEKEKEIAFASGFAATASKDMILKRYAGLSAVPEAPVVVEGLPKKTKELVAMVRKIFGDLSDKAIKQRTVRAGKGKNRGRKYKSSAGLLIVTGKDEQVSCTVFDVKPIHELVMADLYPLGRLTLYTKKALAEVRNVA